MNYRHVACHACEIYPCLCNKTSTNCVATAELGVRFTSDPFLVKYGGKTGTELHVKGCLFDTSPLFVRNNYIFRLYSLWDGSKKIVVTNTKLFQYQYRTNGKYENTADYTFDGVYQCYAEIYDAKMNFLANLISAPVMVDFSDVFTSILSLSYTSMPWNDILRNTKSAEYINLKNNITSDVQELINSVMKFSKQTPKLELMNVYERNGKTHATFKLNYLSVTAADKSEYCSDIQKLTESLQLAAYDCNITTIKKNNKTVDVENTKDLEGLSNEAVCSFNKTVDCSNPEDVVLQLNKLVANESTVKTISDVDNVAKTIQNIDAHIESGTREKTMIFRNVIEATSHLLNVNTNLIAKAEYLKQSSTKILKSLDSLSIKVSKNLSSSNYSLTTKNIAVLLKKTIPKDITLCVASHANKIEIISSKETENRTHASIQVPSEAFSSATNSIVRSFFYTSSKFFVNVNHITRVDNNKTDMEMHTVFSVSIGMTPITNLTSPIILTFRKASKIDENEVCKFWDFKMKTQYKHILGGWSERGCKRVPSDKENIIKCECDHLTNFALILNTAQKESSPLSLRLITWIGCGISIAGLMLTIIVYCLTSNLRRKFASKLLISLCISLMITLLLFLIGAERTQSTRECLAIAASLHYFLLTTFFWMAVEGFNLYRYFVHSFKITRSTNVHFFWFSMFAWGVPAVIVAITAAFDRDHFGNDKLCVVYGNAFYYGVLLPTCVILLSNFIILKLSITQMRAPDILKTLKYQEYRQQLVRVFLCSTLLGLTWTFAILAIGHLRDVFQYLFCIFNSLQGFCIFMLFVVYNKRVRSQIATFVKLPEYKTSEETTKYQMKTVQ